MSRQLKELRSLMPWTWDARIEEHPAGESSLRDFKKVYRWGGDDQGRRSGGAHRDVVATPAPLLRKRAPKVVATGGDSMPSDSPVNATHPKQAPSSATAQTPCSTDSAASSGGHLSVPAATPGGLRSSGRSANTRRNASATTGSTDAATPAPYAPSASPPDSALSTGDRMTLLPPASAGATGRRRALASGAPLAMAMAAGMEQEVAEVAAPAEAPAAAGLQPQPAAALAASGQTCPNAALESPAKTFEAKLAAVDEGCASQMPAEGADPPTAEDASELAPVALPMGDSATPAADSTEHELSEESMAAATLLELPRPQARRPMHDLDTNIHLHRSPRSKDKPNSTGKRAGTQPQAQGRSGLLDAARSAACMVRRPPQQKRTARPISAAARALSPRLLTPGAFPGWQPPAAVLPPATVATAALPILEESSEPAAATLPPAFKAEALLEVAATPTTVVSQAPPQLPELPPIAPLVLQPVRVALCADVPQQLAGFSGRQPAASRLSVVQTGEQLPSAVSRPIGIRASAAASASWTPAQSYWLPSTPVPAKRPGEPLDLQHACKLLKWMDALDQARHSCK